MKKVFSLIVLTSLLFACSKESYYTLTPAEDIVSFIPNNKVAKHYRSNNGDTVAFFQYGIDTTFARTSQDIGSTGNVGTLDYVEVRQHKAVLAGLDNPYKVKYELNSFYDASLGSRSRDILTVNYLENDEELAQLSVTFTDSLICSSDRCDFLTSLKLQEKTFSNVYFLKRDSVNHVSLYINQAKGLVGFRTTDNRIFELID